MNRINFILIFFIFIGCEQNEIPIEKHPIGEIETIQINMESNYSKQIFFSLNDKNGIIENIKTEWDLGFEASKNGNKIIINSSTFSQISILEDGNFDDPIIIEDLIWQWDNPKGIENGTAFNTNQINSTYILDRGYNIDGTKRGYRKIRIDSINDNSYFFSYSNLDNTNLNNFEIKKDSLLNFQYFSFNTNNIANIEPEKNNWDLVFTQYTHLYPNNIETPAYLVTGVLTNYLNNVIVAIDSLNSFDSISIDLINSYNFSNFQDKIGYNWKFFNFDSQTYTVKPEITYIIKDISNRYYKLHFIDFYNDLGEKGYPKFEIQEL